MTANVTLAQGFKKETGSFSANVEFFVLRGVLKIGNFVYRKHSYSYIPAGQVLGEWSVEAGDKTDDLVGQMEDGDVEIVWMQDGACSFTAGAVAESDSFHEDFIPIIDAFCMPWGGTQTSQFAVSRKKWLRKNALWRRCMAAARSPHFDSKEPCAKLC